MSNIFPDGIPLLQHISPPFKSELDLKPTEFNLFTGMNGSGKTLMLEHITNILDNDMQKEHNLHLIPIKEDRFYLGKINYTKGAVSLQNFVNTANIAPDTPEKDQLNTDLKHLFQREVDIITDRSGVQYPQYKKQNGNVHVSQDGRGILNTWTILEYISHAPDGFPLVVEEISLGLHPSLLEKFLDRLFKRLKDKKMQLFASTQDPFVVFYFLKNKITESGDWNDTNPEYSVFHFSENSDGLDVEKITKDNIYSSMSDLMGDFNGSPNLLKFNLLFSKPNS